MKRLIIHQPANHFSNKFRYYNIFFNNLINKISETNEVITSRFNKNVHKGRVPIDLNLYDNENFIIEMQECEMIIEDFDNKDIQILSVSDDLTPTSLKLQSYDNTKKVLISQFIRDKINHHVKEEFRHKYHPWIYFPSNNFSLDFFYEKRKQILNKIDKLYFRGETESRSILKYFDEKYFHGGNSIGGFNEYANELINYKLGFSVSGRGEMCYRDVEYMAMGIPFIRFEYLTEFAEPLIPNYHYISVERSDDLKSWLNLDRTGNDIHSKMILDKFLEIKDNIDFLDFISYNARKYYEDFLSPKNSVNTTIRLLGL